MIDDAIGREIRGGVKPSDRLLGRGSLLQHGDHFLIEGNIQLDGVSALAEGNCKTIGDLNRIFWKSRAENLYLDGAFLVETEKCSQHLVRSLLASLGRTSTTHVGINNGHVDHRVDLYGKI